MDSNHGRDIGGFASTPLMTTKRDSDGKEVGLGRFFSCFCTRDVFSRAPLIFSGAPNAFSGAPNAFSRAKESLSGGANRLYLGMERLFFCAGGLFH